MDGADIAIAKIAKLARLQLSDSEQAAIGAELRAILAYAKQLDELTLDDVPPTAHAVIASAPLREDVPRPGLAFERLSPPAAEGTAFLVPKVIE